MHGQVMSFLKAELQRSPQHALPGVRVLELGSRDINGSPRSCFPAPAYYLGIDCHSGPGVDVVGVVHEILNSRSCEPFVVVVSTEMLEHDPFWTQTLCASVSLLKPGGLFLLSCASRKRGAHHLEDSPVPGHYQGLNPEDLLPVLHRLALWESLDGWTARGDLDTFICGKVGA